MQRIFYILFFNLSISCILLQYAYGAGVISSIGEYTPYNEYDIADTIDIASLTLPSVHSVNEAKAFVLRFPVSADDKVYYTQERFIRSNRMLAIHWIDKTPCCYLFSWPSTVAVRMERIDATTLLLHSLSPGFTLKIESAAYSDFEE